MNNDKSPANGEERMQGSLTAFLSAKGEWLDTTPSLQHVTQVEFTCQDVMIMPCDWGMLSSMNVRSVHYGKQAEMECAVQCSKVSRNSKDGCIQAQPFREQLDASRLLFCRVHLTRQCRSQGWIRNTHLSKFCQQLLKCHRGVQGQVLTLSDFPSNSNLFPFCTSTFYLRPAFWTIDHLISAAQQLKTSAVKSPAQIDFNPNPKSLCSLVSQLSELYIPCFRTNTK